MAVGAKFDGDTLLWQIVDSKLYLNHNEVKQETWQMYVPRNIQKADQNWPKIADKFPQELG